MGSKISVWPNSGISSPNSKPCSVGVRTKFPDLFLGAAPLILALVFITSGGDDGWCKGGAEGEIAEPFHDCLSDAGGVDDERGAVLPGEAGEVSMDGKNVVAVLGFERAALELADGGLNLLVDWVDGPVAWFADDVLLTVVLDDGETV
jgi:hypothetical protein